MVVAPTKAECVREVTGFWGAEGRTVDVRAENQSEVSLLLWVVQVVRGRAEIS